jgi:hypothetical protein
MDSYGTLGGWGSQTIERHESVSLPERSLQDTLVPSKKLRPRSRCPSSPSAPAPRLPGSPGQVSCEEFSTYSLGGHHSLNPGSGLSGLVLGSSVLLFRCIPADLYPEARGAPRALRGSQASCSPRQQQVGYGISLRQDVRGRAGGRGSVQTRTSRSRPMAIRDAPGEVATLGHAPRGTNPKPARAREAASGKCSESAGGDSRSESTAAGVPSRSAPDGPLHGYGSGGRIRSSFLATPGFSGMSIVR